jgi:D-3-phosphoglycerate dehydrogenase
VAQIVVSDPLAPEGFELLESRGHKAIDITKMAGPELAAAIASAEGWVIRSGTNLTADSFAAAPQLKGVGRAGVGVDNVDLKAATEAGVAVFNSPTGNITSACEQAWALLLAGARRVVEADNAMKQKDWARKRLKGMELAGKTLFIVGLGKIGRMMAARAQAFEMNVIGHDPFVTPEAAKSFGVTWVSVEDGFKGADIISLHTPLVPATADLVNAERLALCKPGTVFVNAARGGLMVANDVYEALENGQLAFAGIDVWPEEPPTDWKLAQHPRVVAAPHLGASTVEAQLKAALQACERLCDFLDDGDAGLAVNAQSSVPGPMQPWAQLTEALAGFLSQSAGSTTEIHVCATPAIQVKSLEAPAIIGALRGTSENVNGINAPGLANERGWIVSTRELPEDDTEYVRITMRATTGEMTMEGTYTPNYGARVTSIDGFPVEFRPEGRFLFTRHNDVPGVLAGITGALAQSKVNVANMSLARRDGLAVSVIEVDGSIPQEARDALRDLDAIQEAHRIRLA